MKIQTMLLKAFWWCRIVLFSLRWVASFNLGDMVVFEGKVFSLLQGNKHPIWTISNGIERIEVNESEFRKVRTPANYWRGFKSGYRFYMGYWFQIWVREGIQPWMRSCNIWGMRK